MKFILISIFFLLSSCVKNVDAVYDSPKSKDRVVIAQFPVSDHDKNNQRAIDTCQQFVKIQDSSCLFEESKVFCQSNPKTKNSSYCVINGKRVE